MQVQTSHTNGHFSLRLSANDKQLTSVQNFLGRYMYNQEASFFPLKIKLRFLKLARQPSCDTIATVLVIEAAVKLANLLCLCVQKHCTATCMFLSVQSL